MEASNSLLCVNKHYEQYTSKLLAISKPLSPKQTKTYTHAYFHCINISFHEQHWKIYEKNNTNTVQKMGVHYCLVLGIQCLSLVKKKISICVGIQTNRGRLFEFHGYVTLRFTHFIMTIKWPWTLKSMSKSWSSYIMLTLPYILHTDLKRPWNMGTGFKVMITFQQLFYIIIL